TIGMAIIAQPETNELAAANAVLAELDAMLPEFPPGVTYSVPYNPTEFVEASIAAVQQTLLEAVLLVVVVIVVCLQTCRAAIIPIVVIPVALIGAMAALLVLGYSLNSLALFALVLAVGIVVDDAIVVVENVERDIRAGLTPREAAHRTMDEVSGGLIAVVPALLVPGAPPNSLALFALVLAVGIVVDDAIVVVENVERNIRAGLTPKEAAHRTMDEVSGALIAIGLVLLSVFIPTAFVSGIPGLFYRQFAVTIAAAATISLLLSLTLTPAMAAVLLRPHEEGHADGSSGPRWVRPLRRAGNAFNRYFDKLGDRYGQLTTRTVRHAAMMLVLYAGLLALTGWRFAATPSGFIPEQDQGALIGVITLPPGASSARTNEIMQQAMAIVEDLPGIEEVVAFSGFNAASSSLESNSGALFARLDPFEKRERDGVTAVGLSQVLSQRLAAIQGASIVVIPPPTVQGMGNGGGWRMMIQDRTGANYAALEAAANDLVAAAATVPEVVGAFSQLSTGAPRLFGELDRDKSQLLGVHPADVFSTMNVYLGSLYVNDLNLFGRTYQVIAQAEPTYRDDRSDILNLRVRSVSGEMVPLASVLELKEDSGATRVIRHNLFPTADIRGQPAPGFSSAQALDAMERLAAEHLPQGMSFEWTDIAFQERLAGNTGILV